MNPVTLPKAKQTFGKRQFEPKAHRSIYWKFNLSLPNVHTVSQYCLCFAMAQRNEFIKYET